MDEMETPQQHSFQSLGRVIKKIHEARPDLSTAQMMEIIQASKEGNKVDEVKALALATQGSSRPSGR